MREEPPFGVTMDSGFPIKGTAVPPSQPAGQPVSEVSRVQEPERWPCTKPRVRTHPGGRGPLPEVDQCTHDVCRPKGPTVVLDATPSGAPAGPSTARPRPWDGDYATAYASLHEVVRAFLAGERNARYLRRMHAEIESELTGGGRRG